MNKCIILCVGDNGEHHIGDEYNVAFSIREQLIQYFPQYYIVLVESGAEALVTVANYQAEGLEIPLVIVDQMISDMTGAEFLIS